MTENLIKFVHFAAEQTPVIAADFYTVLAAAVSIVPGVLAYYGAKRATNKRIGIISERMTEGFSSAPIKSFQAVIEAQADEIRRLRNQQIKDESRWRAEQQHWLKSETDLRRQLASARLDKEKLQSEIQRLKEQVLELEERVNQFLDHTK